MKLLELDVGLGPTGGRWVWWCAGGTGTCAQGAETVKRSWFPRQNHFARGKRVRAGILRGISEVMEGAPHHADRAAVPAREGVRRCLGRSNSGARPGIMVNNLMDWAICRCPSSAARRLGNGARGIPLPVDLSSRSARLGCRHGNRRSVVGAGLRGPGSTRL